MSDIYIPNAGQTLLPAEENTKVGELDFIPLQPPAKLLPITFTMKESFLDKGFSVGDVSKQEFLPGVSAKMLDWFWANMEKCYYLWAPGAHKSFRWLKAPNCHGFLNSAHEIVEPHGPVNMCIQISRLNPQEWYPFTECLDHMICEGIYNNKGELNDATIHMWQDVEGGCVHIYASMVNNKISELPDCILKLIADLQKLNSEGEVVSGQPPVEETQEGETINGSQNHSAYESAMWPKFLPQMYALWDGHPDPSQNVPCDLTVKMDENGNFCYLSENSPVC